MLTATPAEANLRKVLLLGLVVLGLVSGAAVTTTFMVALAHACDGGCG
jgi:hypothetical protein